MVVVADPEHHGNAMMFEILFASRFLPRPFCTQCRSVLRDCSGVWLRFGVLRRRRRGPEHRCSLVHCFLGCLCWEIAGF